MVLEFFRKYLFSARAGALVKKISWLTVIGLTISVSSLILVISVMTALNRNIQARTLAVEPHLTIEIPEVRSASLLDLHPLTTKLKNNPDLKIQVYENQDVILRTLDGHFRGAIARGLSQDSLNRMITEMQKLDQKKRGQPLSIEVLAPGEVLMGVDLAVSLGVFEGDSIMVVPPESLLLPPGEMPKLEKVKVKRIISTSLADVDSQNIFYIRDHSLRRLKDSQSRLVGIEVWTPDANHAEDYRDEVKAFPEARVQTWKERNSALFFALRLEKIVITLFLSMAALIASFSMISVLVLLISQKRREIGLLQAIGFSIRKVQQLFMQIGLCLGGLGLVAGLILGSLLSFWLEKYPLNVLPDIYYDSEIPAYLDMQFVLIVFLLGAWIAVVGSYYSSRGAARVLPSEALRAKN
ncbi:MAG: FtsX-like permease family protein [Pseudobdellovibrionaceae bacterium]